MTENVEYAVKTPAMMVEELKTTGKVTLGALRFNDTKPMMSLVPGSLNRYTAMVLTYGAKKYEPNNWRKGFKWTSILDSLERHLTSFKDGEDYDDESGLPHVAHIACNVAFLIEHFDKSLGEDDRWPAGVGKVLSFNEPPTQPK